MLLLIRFLYSLLIREVEAGETLTAFRRRVQEFNNAATEAMAPAVRNRLQTLVDALANNTYRAPAWKRPSADVFTPTTAKTAALTVTPTTPGADGVPRQAYHLVIPRSKASLKTLIEDSITGCNDPVQDGITRATPLLVSDALVPYIWDLIPMLKADVRTTCGKFFENRVLAGVDKGQRAQKLIACALAISGCFFGAKSHCPIISYHDDDDYTDNYYTRCVVPAVKLVTELQVIAHQGKARKFDAHEILKNKFHKNIDSQVCRQHIGVYSSAFVIREAPKDMAKVNQLLASGISWPMHRVLYKYSKKYGEVTDWQKYFLVDSEMPKCTRIYRDRETRLAIYYPVTPEAGAAIEPEI